MTMVQCPPQVTAVDRPTDNGESYLLLGASEKQSSQPNDQHSDNQHGDCDATRLTMVCGLDGNSVVGHRPLNNMELCDMKNDDTDTTPGYLPGANNGTDMIPETQVGQEVITMVTCTE